MDKEMFDLSIQRSPAQQEKITLVLFAPGLKV